MILEIRKDKEEEKIRLESRVLMLSMVEVEILRFLNEFGFCEISHIIKQFCMRKTCAYDYMSRLLKRELIINARVLKFQPRAYYLTLRGIDILKLHLPLIKKIPLNIYEHQLAVIDVYLTLMKIYPDATWISERRLIREKADSNDHLPDGVLVFPDGKYCAVEVEKTLKAKDRLEDIMLRYGLQLNYKEVWYFCSTSVMPSVTKFAASMPYIKVFRLGDFIS